MEILIQPLFTIYYVKVYKIANTKLDRKVYKALTLGQVNIAAVIRRKIGFFGE